MCKQKKKSLKIFDKKLMRIFGLGASAILSIFSVIVLFLPWEKYQFEVRSIVLIGLILFLLLAYIVIRICLLKMSKITISVNDNKVTIQEGDLFACESSALKVVPFNEYFDTQVGPIISEETLNGQYIKKIYSNSAALSNLDSRISNDLVGQATMRSSGKSIQYPLGSVYLDVNNYALLAFSKFDDVNRANLTFEEYFQCLMNMWKNLDRIYNGKQIVIPLIGTGITRFNGHLSEQDALETILTSLRLFNGQFINGITVLVTHEKMTNLSLYKLSN